jgi:hypothetical protein
MAVKHLADTEVLRQTALRLARAGLVIDPATLSPAQRRAFFALQCDAAAATTTPEPRRAPIGFAYPNARCHAQPACPREGATR